MISKYEPLLYSNSTTHLNIRSYTQKRLQQFSNIQQNSRPPTRVHLDDMDLSVFKNISCKNLGPGCYKIPTPPPGPSCNFGYAQRFKLSPPRSMSQTKPANLIKENKKLCRYTPEGKKEKLQKVMNQNRLNECISREAKRIIQTGKIERLKEQINEKFNKAEVTKLKKQKKSVLTSYVLMLINLQSAQTIRKLIKKRKEYKDKIQRYLMSISVICKAFGKFKRSLGVAKKTIALRIMKKYLPKYVKKFIEYRKKKYSEIVMDVVDNFSKYVSVSRINYMVNFQIRNLQKMIRNFLVVSRFRKHALRIMWNKIDLKARKVPEKIQHYYISSYLSNLFEDYLRKRKRMIRYALFMTMTETVESEEVKTSEIIERPFFRVFYVKNVKKMIAKAWDEQEKWPNINFNEFPIKFGKEKRAETNHMQTVIKRRKTMMRSKRGNVTFKHV